MRNGRWMETFGRADVEVRRPRHNLTRHNLTTSVGAAGNLVEYFVENLIGRPAVRPFVNFGQQKEKGDRPPPATAVRKPIPFGRS